MGLLPAAFMISDLGVGVGRWHTGLGNSKGNDRQYENVCIFNLPSECVGFHYLSRVFPGRGFCGLTPGILAGPSSSLRSHQHRSAEGSSAITHKPSTRTGYLPICSAMGLTEGGPTALSHRFSVRVLPQITVAVARRGYADVALLRTVASQATVTTGAIVMDRLEGRHLP